jgi:hypothetical protein
VVKTPRSRAAFDAALAHPAGRRFLAALPIHGAIGLESRTPGDAASLPVRASALLAAQRVGLAPREQSRRVLRLVWLDNRRPSGVVADSPATCSAPPPPPPAMPASSLVDAPDDVSPQAQTLFDAAQNGTPFCEECARRAAALALANA